MLHRGSTHGVPTYMADQLPRYTDWYTEGGRTRSTSWRQEEHAFYIRQEVQRQKPCLPSNVRVHSCAGAMAPPQPCPLSWSQCAVQRDQARLPWQGTRHEKLGNLPWRRNRCVCCNVHMPFTPIRTFKKIRFLFACTSQALIPIHCFLNELSFIETVVLYAWYGSL